MLAPFTYTLCFLNKNVVVSHTRTLFGCRMSTYAYRILSFSIHRPPFPILIGINSSYRKCIVRRTVSLFLHLGYTHNFIYSFSYFFFLFLVHSDSVLFCSNYLENENKHTLNNNGVVVRCAAYLLLLLLLPRLFTKCIVMQ